MSENSPVLQHWVGEVLVLSPEGATETRWVSRPFGTGMFRAWLPNDESLGYCHLYLWDKDVSYGQKSWRLSTYIENTPDSR